MEKVLETLRQTIVEQFRIAGDTRKVYDTWFAGNIKYDDGKICLNAFLNAIIKARELTGLAVPAEVLNDIWTSWSAELREENICIVVPARGSRIERLDQEAIFVIDLRRKH